MTATAVARVLGKVVIQENLYDAGYELQWLKLSEGGAWMLRIFDASGKWIDGAVADDPEEALLAVAEWLLP